MRWHRAALPLLLAVHLLAPAQAAQAQAAQAQGAGHATTAAAQSALAAMAPASGAAAPTAVPNGPGGATPGTHPVEGPSFTPMVVALLVVLGLMAAVLWVLRRTGLAPRPGGTQPMRLVSQLSLGPRERVVIVEVADRWLLLGVGTAGIARLGFVPKGETATPPPAVAFGTLIERLRKGAA
jgi:flagellar protein FliO/FliZ